MFKASLHSNESISSLGQESAMKQPVSTETLSLLSRSVTATSINSTSTVNTTFETNWMPNSFVVSRKKYKISLKLKPNEIELLRKSWAIVTSNETRASDLNALERTISRDSSSVNLKLTQTETNVSNNSIGISKMNSNISSNSVSNSTSSPTINNNLNNNTNTTNNNTIGLNSSSFQSFASFLFCIQFYNNLIGMDPEIERLIPSIRHQASAFAGVISVAIGTLEDLSKMKESLLNLGHLHARILGIDSPYFKIMGEALIKTFQDWFGNSPESFPLELEEAWIKLYCFLANSIIQGGIDPIIEYNLQPANYVDNSEQIDENDEIDNDNDNDNNNNKNDNDYINEKDDKLSNLYNSDLDSGYTASLAGLEDSFKRATISKHSSNQTMYSKYEPSINSSPLNNTTNNNNNTTKSSYIPNVATKNINRFKKSKNGNKEDCTIM
jgi:hemoglobin-like flavoprotein